MGHSLIAEVTDGERAVLIVVISPYGLGQIPILCLAYTIDPVVYGLWHVFALDIPHPTRLNSFPTLKTVSNASGVHLTPMA